MFYLLQNALTTGKIKAAMSSIATSNKTGATVSSFLEMKLCHCVFFPDRA